MDKNRQLGNEQMHVLAEHIGSIVPEGFILLVLPFESPGSMVSYISNVERNSVIRAARELADKLENHDDFDTSSIN